MKKSTLIIVIVIMALCITGMSAGGVKIIDNINAVIDANREPDISVSEPDIYEYVDHVVSINNSSIGLNSHNGKNEVAFYSDEYIAIEELSFIVVRYDLNGSRYYPMSQIEFSNLYNVPQYPLHNAQSLSNNFVIADHEDSTEPYDQYYVVRLGDYSNYYATLESITFVYSVESSLSLKCYVYINDICIGSFTDNLEKKIMLNDATHFVGVSLSFQGQLENEFIFDNIDVYTFASTYEGDLYDITGDTYGNISDSKDFTAIINAH